MGAWRSVGPLRAPCWRWRSRACAATTTAISKRNLDVQTKMTESIFLDPVPADRAHRVRPGAQHLRQARLRHRAAVRSAIESRGYRVVDDPTEAHYLLQANVLQAGRSSETAAEDTFAGGFGSTMLGGAAGAGAGRVLSENPAVIIGGALAGAAISAVADAFVQDVTYSIISDVQVSERAAEGVVVTESARQDLSQGTSGNRVLSSTETSELEALPHPGDEQGQQGQPRVRGSGPRPGRRPHPLDRRDLLSPAKPSRHDRRADRLSLTRVALSQGRPLELQRDQGGGDAAVLGQQHVVGAAGGGGAIASIAMPSRAQRGAQLGGDHREARRRSPRIRISTGGSAAAIGARLSAVTCSGAVDRPGERPLRQHQDRARVPHAGDAKAAGR